MRKRIAIVGAIIGTTAGIGISRTVRTWRTWGIDPLEARKPLAGDELVPVPSAIETRSITIDAPPEAVWPWLVQMGFDRGGWYSYDQLDMRGTSAARILPEYQAIAVGDIVPTSPTTGFIVREVQPGRALVLFSDTALVQSQAAAAADAIKVGERPVPAGLAASGAFLGRTPQEFAASWAFTLEPLDGGRTRLIERFRVRFEAPATGIPRDRPDHGLRRLRDGAPPAPRHPRAGRVDGRRTSARAARGQTVRGQAAPAPANGRAVELAPKAEIVAVGA